MSIKKELQLIIKSALDKLNIPISLNKINIVSPKKEITSQYSTNIALTLNKTNPMELANLIKGKITSHIIANIEVLSPGFINFSLTQERLHEEINNIITESKNYGKNNLGNNQKINIEYVSINPTITLDINSTKEAIYGDNLSRIMNFCGYDVTREYYLNSQNKQSINYGISPDEYYQQPFLDTSLKQLKQELDTIRVNFDVFTTEQSLYTDGLIEKILTTYKNNNNCYIDSDSLWLKVSPSKNVPDHIIVKNDGEYTDLLISIAYHINKIARGYDKLIDIYRVSNKINSLKLSLDLLGYNSKILDIKTVQPISLINASEKIIPAISLKEMLEQLDINTIRYLFASRKINTQMKIDLSPTAKNNLTNQIYYIEYANTRISKILNTYKKEIKPKDKYNTLQTSNTYTIMNKLMKFQDTIINAVEKQHPHLICNYVYELATIFHSYYTKEKILSNNEEYTAERMNLLKAIKIVINNSLNLIGIIPREQM